ncbi:MAG: hypothetical protein XD96_0229 [Petrotoga mobilis]|uniref:Uncharacterized protein n=1 Tax=Petrotoga sibirica TaxID=156202 RepID=A0A4R8EMR6_9BACT|nr:MAG: hypothetical protein XD96_0229 [Petrotoga mobilis]TDX13229.1 hypothetical protein C8D74_11268 [Petrotoga sibirica]
MKIHQEHFPIYWRNENCFKLWYNYSIQLYEGNLDVKNIQVLYISNKQANKQT